MASNVVDVPILINLSGPALTAGVGLIVTDCVVGREPQPAAVLTKRLMV